MLCNKACNGFCFDRGIYITFGFGEDDFQVVTANIDSLKLNPQYVEENKKDNNPNYAVHRFAERTKKDGTTWVYDTSLGLAFEKNLYYEMQNPDIKNVMNKEATINHGEYKEIKNANIEKEKYASPLLIPIYEYQTKKHAVYKVTHSIAVDYTEELKKEIELFKKEIDYDSICEEVENDMKSMGLL